MENAETSCFPAVLAAVLLSVLGLCILLLKWRWYENNFSHTAECESENTWHNFTKEESIDVEEDANVSNKRQVRMQPLQLDQVAGPSCEVYNTPLQESRLFLSVTPQSRVSSYYEPQLDAAQQGLFLSLTPDTKVSSYYDLETPPQARGGGVRERSFNQLTMTPSHTTQCVFSLNLGLDFDTIGAPDSHLRARFIHDLQQDLSNAAAGAGMFVEKHDFEILHLLRGSANDLGGGGGGSVDLQRSNVVAHIRLLPSRWSPEGGAAAGWARGADACALVLKLQRQASDPVSPLLAGTVTKFVEFLMIQIQTHISRPQSPTSHNLHLAGQC